MAKMAMSEILKRCAEFKKKEERVYALQQNCNEQTKNYRQFCDGSMLFGTVCMWSMDISAKRANHAGHYNNDDRARSDLGVGAAKRCGNEGRTKKAIEPRFLATDT